MGLFTVKDEDDSLAEQRHISLLFKKERKPSPPLSTAAAVRLASSSAMTTVDTPSAKNRQPVAVNKTADTRRNTSEAKPSSNTKPTPQAVNKPSEVSSYN